MRSPDILTSRAAFVAIVAGDKERPSQAGRMSPLVEALSIVAALATAVQAAALVVLHLLLPTGYNPVRDAVSDYGVGRYRAGFWVQVVAGGVASIALAVALAQLTPYKPTFVVVMLFVSAVARFLMPFFPTGQSGNRFETLPGTIHMILAVVSFGGLVVAATGLWTTLRRYPAGAEPRALSQSSLGQCSEVSSPSCLR